MAELLKNLNYTYNLNDELSDPSLELKKIKKVFKPFLIILLITTLIGVFTSFSLFVTLTSSIMFLLLIYGLLNPLVGFFAISILFALDPIVRVYLLDGGLLRWNTLNYWLIFYSVVNLQLLLKNLSRQITTGIAFFFILVFQLSYSENLIEGSQHILGFSSFFGIYIYFLSVRKYNISVLLFYAIILAGLSTLLAGLIFFYQNGFAAFDISIYFKQGLTLDEVDLINANAFAAMLTSAVMIAALSINFITNKTNRKLVLFLVWANTGLILFSGSRGALLVALFSIYFIISKEKKIFNLILLIIAAYLALLLSVPLFKKSDNLIAKKIVILFDKNASEANKTSGRSDIAKVGFEIFKDNPMGVGTGNFTSTFAKYSTKVDFEISSRLEQSRISAHSGLIKILAENGVVGILIFSTFILSFFTNKKSPLHTQGLYTIIIVFVTFLSSEFQNKPLWMVCAIVAYLNLVESKKLKEKII